MSSIHHISPLSIEHAHCSSANPPVQRAKESDRNLSIIGTGLCNKPQEQTTRMPTPRPMGSPVNEEYKKKAEQVLQQLAQAHVIFLPESSEKK